jgi:hypothetical protein
VGSSGMGRISTTTQSSRRLVRMPTEYFKRLLEEACPNHAYPIRHKLKDCGMMQIFMTLESLTWGAKSNEGPNWSNTTPFAEGNAIMTVFEGHP